MNEVDQSKLKLSQQFPPMSATGVLKTSSNNFEETTLHVQPSSSSEQTLTGTEPVITVTNTAETPALQETLTKLMSRVNQMETAFVQMQTSATALNAVPNLYPQYFQIPQIPQIPGLNVNPTVFPSSVETEQNSVHFEQDQISLHPQDLLPEHVEERPHEDSESSSCQTAESSGDRHQKISDLFSDKSESSSSSQKRKKKSEEDDLQLHEEIIDNIIGERQTKQNNGPAILKKLAVGVKKFWTEDSKNNKLLKDYKQNLLIPENCEFVKVPLLNDDILKNKNIHYYYKRNDKKYSDMQQYIVQASTAIINIANECLEADKSNKIVESKVLVSKAADALTIMGKVNSMITNERKTRLKPALSESYQSLCDQDFSESMYLLGDDLPEEMKKARSRHVMEASISKRQKTSPSSQVQKRRPTESLNWQGRKKNHQGPTSHMSRPHRNNSHRFQKKN